MVAIGVISTAVGSMVGDVGTWLGSGLNASQRVRTTAPVAVRAASLRPSCIRRARPWRYRPSIMSLAWYRTTEPTPEGAGPVSEILEATMGFEPMMGVLQTPALTTWLRRPLIDTKPGRLPPTLWTHLVPRKGFEPLRPKARPPQDRVSASSTTSA